MKDTFEYSGDYEWALWRDGAMCAMCSAWDGTESEAVGVKYAVYGRLTASEPSEIHVTPVCEEHAHGDVLRFVKEDNPELRCAWCGEPEPEGGWVEMAPNFRICSYECSENY